MALVEIWSNLKTARDYFDNDIRSLEDFKDISNIIITNRIADVLEDVEEIAPKFRLPSPIKNNQIIWNTI